MRDPISGATGRPTGPADTDLALLALRYAAGELTPAGAEAFEYRLAADQAARDALAEAVRLSAAASGLPAPAPDPLVRQAVREKLHPTWLTRLFPRRPYRGHPAAWAGVGGTVAAAVAVVAMLNRAGDSDVVVAPVAAGDRVPPPPPDGPPTGDTKWVAGDPLANPKLNPMGYDDRSPLPASRIPNLAGGPEVGAGTTDTVPKPMPMTTTPRAEGPTEPDAAEPTVGAPSTKKG